jgi:hypothetical protein
MLYYEKEFKIFLLNVLCILHLDALTYEYHCYILDQYKLGELT